MYYYLSWLDEGWVPLAEGADDPQRDLVLAATSEVEDWRPLEVTVAADELVDYLPNNVGVRLCSERIREVIDQALGPLDRVQWLPAVVVDTSARSTTTSCFTSQRTSTSETKQSPPWLVTSSLNS